MNAAPAAAVMLIDPNGVRPRQSRAAGRRTRNRLTLMTVILHSAPITG
jgi:hypothetical protein